MAEDKKKSTYRILVIDDNTSIHVSTKVREALRDAEEEKLLAGFS